AVAQVVQVAAQRPQIGLRLVEALRGLVGQHAVADQLPQRVGAVEELADPAQGLQVAQSALPLLDAGLELVARRAEFLVPRFALGELGLVEGLALAGHTLLEEALAELVVELLVAPQVARFEERGLDGEVALGPNQALVDGARRLANLQPE